MFGEVVQTHIVLIVFLNVANILIYFNNRLRHWLFNILLFSICHYLYDNKHFI